MFTCILPHNSKRTESSRIEYSLYNTIKRRNDENQSYTKNNFFSPFIFNLKKKILKNKQSTSYKFLDLKQNIFMNAGVTIKILLFYKNLFVLVLWLKKNTESGKSFE